MISFPNAKINIGLFVTGKRPDGFHNLETIFFPVGWSDALEIAQSDKIIFTSSGIEIDGPAESNLVMKAYYLLRDEYQLPPLHIHLHKQIPFGAGLGGGSADAAFMLQMLSKMFNLNITSEKMLNYAASLGSDCPFFLVNQPVFAIGRGEIMSRVDISLKGLSILLVKPPVEVSTATAFSNVTIHKPEVSLAEMVKRPVSEWKNLIVNQFEYSVFPQFPEIEEIKSTLYKLGAVYASMSGSGSCVFGLFFDLPENTESLFPASYQTFSQRL
jgi:4-diphosphocytidyl-2-C-methyl-D-erythritol kinase